MFRGVFFGRPKKNPPFKTTTGLKCFSAEELRLEAVLEALLGMICLLFRFESVNPPETEHDKGKAIRLKMYLLLKLLSFHCHVSFQGHICVEFSRYTSMNQCLYWMWLKLCWNSLSRDDLNVSAKLAILGMLNQGQYIRSNCLAFAFEEKVDGSLGLLHPARVPLTK